MCSEVCHPGIAGECGDGYDCTQTEPGLGVCIATVADGATRASASDKNPIINSPENPDAVIVAAAMPGKPIG